MKNQLLRSIPRVDDLLRHPMLSQLDIPSVLLTESTRNVLSELRTNILDNQIDELPCIEQICAQIADRIHAAALPSLREVINATGVSLHTNLGRACLSESAAQAAMTVACRYSTLEYDLVSGSRGSRHSHVQELLCRITGAESGMVVNNNAAAVLLILSSVANGGEVIASRGELVEIGGSFRIPEIMEQCGCRLHEVGTTNKTHIRDYRAAISEETCALLKVHTSNYRIMGFTDAVSLSELVELGQEVGLPVIEDLGSGCLINLKELGIYDEPTVMDSVKAGVDVISFSGDKLLGGPQAGIIIGRKKWIDRFKSHPLARAVRVDKMTLAALEATIYSYLDPLRALKEIPILRMLSAKPNELKFRAEQLCALMREQGVDASVIPEQDQVGGGSVPCQLLPAYVVAVTPTACTVEELERALHRLDRPIIGRIAHDRYLIDVRTIWDEDFPYIVEQAKEIAT